MFKNIFNSAKKFFGFVVEETVVETPVEVAVEEAMTVETPVAAPVTIADKATIVLNNISAAKADAQEKAVYYTAEVTNIEAKIAAIQAEITTGEETLAQLKPIADLYEDGAAEFAAAKLTEAKKVAEIAKVKALTLHTEEAKLVAKAAEMSDIAEKASEIANKGGELSVLTSQLKGLIDKTQYKIGGLEELDAEVTDIAQRYSRTSGIATIANATATKKLKEVKQAIMTAEIAVNNATAAVNVALQTVNAARAAEDAVAQTVAVRATVAQKNEKLKELKNKQSTAAKAAYTASQDTENLAKALEIATKAVDTATSLSEKMDEYESVICSSLCADSRDEAKAALLSSGIFTDTEAEEILDANW